LCHLYIFYIFNWINRNLMVYILRQKKIIFLVFYLNTYFGITVVYYYYNKPNELFTNLPSVYLIHVLKDLYTYIYHHFQVKYIASSSLCSVTYIFDLVDLKRNTLKWLHNIYGRSAKYSYTISINFYNLKFYPSYFSDDVFR
jgi:hypothetical protein